MQMFTEITFDLYVAHNVVQENLNILIVYIFQDCQYVNALGEASKDIGFPFFPSTLILFVQFMARNHDTHLCLVL